MVDRNAPFKEDGLFLEGRTDQLGAAMNRQQTGQKEGGGGGFVVGLDAGDPPIAGGAPLKCASLDLIAMVYFDRVPDGTEEKAGDGKHPLEIPPRIAADDKCYRLSTFGAGQRRAEFRERLSTEMGELQSECTGGFLNDYRGAG